MPHWDVFHGDRLEAERSLTTEAVRAALARGDLVVDDLIRPAGETRWARLGDSPEFAPAAPPIENEAPFEPPAWAETPSIGQGLDEPGWAAPVEPEGEPHPRDSLDREALARVEREPIPGPGPSQVSDFELAADSDFEVDARPASDPGYPRASDAHTPPVLPDEEAGGPGLPELVDPEFDVYVEEDEVEPEEFDPQDEDDEAAEFTLSRNSVERVEELDLAAMVDVAFQLVLFFLVTAQVVLYKTLEIPRPNEDKPPEAAAQAKTRSVDELEKDYILVEVDANGAIKVDRQPVDANRPALVERLRASRQATARKAMLLSADFATRHENAVLVFDVASEIDLRIAIAQPAGKK